MPKINYIFIIIAGLLFSMGLSAQVYRDSSDCSDLLSFVWAKTAGSDDIDEVHGICSDDDGNIYITGCFSNDMTFQGTTVSSAGFKDFYVAKLDNNGILQWIQIGGGAQDDEGTGIALDSDGNIYVTGNFRGTATFGSDMPNSLGNEDIFLLKYNSSGVYQWGEFLGGFDDDIAGDVCVDNSNNPVITGTYYFAMSIEGGSFISVGMDDFFIAKFNSDGILQWVTDEGSTVDDSGMKITCDDLNNYYVTGEFSGTMNFGPISITASGTNDVFLAKYSSSGGFIWALNVGTSGNNDKAGDVAVSSDNKVYMAMKLDQIADQGRIYIYQTTGFYSSEIAFGGNGSVRPYGLDVDFSGAAYVSGLFSGTANFGDGDVNFVGGSDYFVAKYKTDGSLAFKHVAGSIYVDCGADLCLDNSNNLIVGGYYNNGMYYDGVQLPLTSLGKEDNMVLKYESYFAFESIEVSSINCDSTNMCVDVEVTGGTGLFDYYLDDVAVAVGADSLFNMCGLNVGDHPIVVTDDNNCYISTIVSLTPPTAKPIEIESEYPMCFHDTLQLTLDNASDYNSFIWSLDDQTNDTIDVYDPGFYSVTVTDASSCTTSATTEVLEDADIDLIVFSDTTVCPGISVDLEAQVGLDNYWWSTGSLASIITAVSPDVYSLIVKDGECYYYDTVDVHHFDEYSIDLGDDENICNGDSTLFSVEGDEFVSFLWQDESEENYFWAYAAGEVYVDATDINGCIVSDNANVDILEVEDIELGTNSTYCTNSPIILNPNDVLVGNTYLWSNNQTTQTISVTETGQYFVTVTNENGCFSEDSITLTIYEQPFVDLGEDISFCDGGSDTIEVIGDFSTYVWNNGETLSSILVDASGLFSVTATDINGCFDSDTIIVFESQLQPPYIGYDTTLCEDDIYRLEPMEDYYRYYWQNGTMGEFITISQPGTYSLTVTDEVGCTSSSTISIEYAENPYITGIDASGGQVVISAMGGTEPYVYSYDGDTWQVLNVYTLLPSDYYIFTVMDSNYCSVSIDAFLDATIDVPNFFTPNGDGFNDTWVISGLYQFPDAVIRIYDRYGKLLYEYVDNGIGWKGIYAGRPLPSDTYWYEIRLSSDRRPITGHVTIKR